MIEVNDKNSTTLRDCQKKRQKNATFAAKKGMEQSYFERIAAGSMSGVPYVNEAAMLTVIALLSVFALLFRLNQPLFIKIIGNLNVAAGRQSIFEPTGQDSLVMNIYLLLQAVILCCLLLYGAADATGLLSPSSSLLFLSLAAMLFLAWYVYNYLFILILGAIFTDNERYRTLHTNNLALFCVWGFALFFPVVWFFVVGRYFFVAYIFFIISYLVFRIILIFRTFNIFFNKNTGFLFFSLYLCGSEMTTLVMLYEGMIYIFNIVEKSNICQ